MRCPACARSTLYFFAFASFVALLPGLLRGQAVSVQIPSTTPLSVELLQHARMKTGEPLEGRLLYPVYVENRIAVPAGTVLRGSVIQLDSDRSRRIHSRLRGDFTPFHIPVVRFDQLVLPNGTVQPIVSDTVKDGVPILRLSPPPGKPKGSFIRRQIAEEKQREKMPLPCSPNPAEVIALFNSSTRSCRITRRGSRPLPHGQLNWLSLST